MNVEQMTNEELAEVNDYLTEYPDSSVFTTVGYVHDATIRGEISRRLRNSIPKPVVELYEYDSIWYVRINGSEVLAKLPLTYHEAQLWLAEVKHALGMKGGGDE